MTRPSFEVERWTLTSRVSMIAAALILLTLALGPLLFSDNAIDRLTTLFVYVILAVMWNALAGYAGLVSIGQQVFFGLGAYATIRLSYGGMNVYAAILTGTLLAGC